MRKKIAIASGIALLVPLALVAMALIALQWSCVRAAAANQLLGLLQGVIAGKLAVDDARWPALERVELSGIRLDDRYGQRVAGIATLSVRLRLAPLWTGTVVLDEVNARGVFADLGVPGSDRGLLSVLASENPAQPEKDTGALSPVEVRIERLCLQGNEISIKPGAETSFALHGFDACAKLRVADTIEVGLDRLRGQLVYNGAPTLTWVDEKVLPSGSAAHGFLRGRVQVKGSALGFDGRVELRGVSRSTLRTLKVNIDGLREMVDVSASVSGDTARMRYQVELRVADSRVHARGEFRPQKSLTAELSSGDLKLARLMGRKVEPLSFALEVQADLSRPSGPSLRVKLPRGRYGAWPLPVSEVQAEFAQNGDITISSFKAGYPSGSAEGNAHIDGRGAITARVKLSVAALERLPPLQDLLPGWAGVMSADATLQRAAHGEGLRLAGDISIKRLRSTSPELAVQKVDLRLSATGSLERPNLEAVLTAEQLSVAKQRFAALRLTARGGPDTYRVIGTLDGERAKVEAWLKPNGDGLTAGGHLLARLPRGELRARVKRVRVASGGVLEIEELRVVHLGTRILAEGSLGLSNRYSQLRVQAEVSDLSVLTDEFAGTKVPGHLRVLTTVRGQLDRPRVDLQAHLEDGPRFFGLSSTLALHARLDAPGGEAELQAKASAGEAAVSATLGSSWRRNAALSTALESAQHELKVNLVRVSLADFVRHADLALPFALSGTLSASLRAAGTRRSFSLHSEANARVRVGEEPHVDVNVRANYDGAEFGLAAELTDKQGRLLTANWHQTASIESWVEKRPTLPEWMEQTAWEASLGLASRRIAELPMLPTLLSTVQRWPLRAELNLKLAHPPNREPTGEVRAVAVWDPMPLATERVTCGHRVRPSVTLLGTLRNGLAVAQFHGNAAKSPAFTLRAEVSSHLNEWLAGKTPELKRAKLTAEIVRFDLAQWPVACEHAAGTLTGGISASHLLDTQAKISARLSGKNLAVDKLPPFDLNLQATAAAPWLNVAARLERNGSRAIVNGRIPIQLQAGSPATFINRDGALSLEVALAHLDLQSLLALVPGVARPSGTLDGKLHVTGTVRAPRGAGSIGLHDVSFTLPRLGQRFTKINGSIAVRNNRVRIPELTVRDQNGSLRLSAELFMDTLTSGKALLSATLDDFPVRNQGVLIGRADGVAKVQLATAPTEIRVEVRLRNASIHLSGDTAADVQSLDPHPEIAVKGETPKVVGQEPREERAKIIGVSIRSDDPLWVRRDDFAVRMNIDLTLSAAGGKSQLSGEVKLERGFISLLGQSFDVKQGRVLFTGGQEVNPRLELTATATASSGKQVRVEVTGFVSAPSLAFFVDDNAANAGQALTVLTGRDAPDSNSQQSAQDQVASAAMGMTTGLLSLGARREFGDLIPMFSFDQGGDQTRLRAGIEADRLIPGFMRGFVRGAYVEGIVSTGSENASDSADQGGNAQSGVLLELMLPWDLVWAGQYGPGQTWSLDLDWRP